MSSRNALTSPEVHVLPKIWPSRRLRLGVLWFMLLTGALTAQMPPRISLATPSGATLSELNAVTSIRELSDGTILVADRGDRQLLHLRFDGSDPVVIGRVGGGPGEYRAVGWLYPLGGDSTLFTDSYSGRWSILLGPRFVATAAASPETQQRYGAELAGADLGGNVLASVGYAFKPGVARLRSSAESLLIVRARRQTESADTIAHLRGRGGGGFSVTQPSGGAPGRILAANPLAAEDHALLTPDGWVAVVRVEPYRVEWRSSDGRWIRGDVLEAERVEVTRPEKCAALARMMGPKAPCDPEMVTAWPATLPPFLPSSMARPIPPAIVDGRGRLLVARTPNASAKANRYDLIDRTARRLGFLELPMNEQVVGFGKSSIMILVTDADGLKHIRRHPW